MVNKDSRSWVKSGVTGAIVTAICCFTPLLPILFGAVGLSAWLGWLDLILLPALAVFILMIGYGVIKGIRT